MLSKQKLGEFLYALCYADHRGDVGEEIVSLIDELKLLPEDYEHEDWCEPYELGLMVAIAFDLPVKEELLEEKAALKLEDKAAALYYEEMSTKDEYPSWHYLNYETRQIYREKAKQ